MLFSSFPGNIPQIGPAGVEFRPDMILKISISGTDDPEEVIRTEQAHIVVFACHTLCKQFEVGFIQIRIFPEIFDVT